MERPRVEEGTAMSLDGDEIGELRKYIVEMMQAEMELMESIKLSEGNISAVNARIKHFKELIVQEQARYKTLKGELVEDTSELQNLEEKKIVAEAKHRQFRDAVAQREREVQTLQVQFQQQRNAMLSLRLQILDATTLLEKLSSLKDSVEMDIRKVDATLNESSGPTEQSAARQKIRAKIIFTQQFISQLKEESNQLIVKKTELEAKVLKCEQEAYKLRESIFLKEKEGTVLFSRLREDTLRVIRENAKIKGKLKAKQRRFRLKTKNDIRSLKRRISFIGSELERGQMTNEDALSIIDALSTKREELEQKLTARNDQLASVENAIAELSKSTAQYCQNRGKFNTTSLQEVLSTKQDEAQVVQTKLDEKQNILKLLDEDHNQLSASLGDISDQIATAKDTAEELEREIASLAKDIEEQEARREDLHASVAKARKTNDDIQAKCQEHQRKSQSMTKSQAKLRHHKDSLLKQEKQLALELREVENLSRVLGEGIKYGAEYARRLSKADAIRENKQKHIEFELRRQELSLQRQCAQEEAKLQAEIAAWDEKIQSLEQELQRL